MRLGFVTTFALILWHGHLPASETILPGPSMDVYRRAQSGRWFADAAKLNPDILPTSDGMSFLVRWKAPGTTPHRWIVSLHGSRGFATDDLAIWHRSLKDRNVGLLSVQWWVGSDDTTASYYAPLQIYREIDIACQKLGVQPGMAMLHGFSRGSANSYAVAAIDAGRGRRYFSLIVASSGGVAMDFPPTRAILDGEFGTDPLRGTRWVTAAGGRDPNPDRDGIPAMRRTAAWLEKQGATVVDRIEDPAEGHGALQRNSTHARRVLDLFLGKQPSVDELLLFFPSKYPDGDWKPADLRFEDVWFSAEDKTRLHGWYCPCDAPRATILIAHGNAGHVASRGPWLRYLQRKARVASFMFDYRGYGRSDGVATVEGAFLDAKAARAKLRALARIEDSQMVLMGESLGGAMVVQLAAESAPRGLILQSTFSSLKDVADVHYPKLSWLVPATKLNSATQIGRYHGPLLQSHGTADRTIPLSSGEKLFQSANEPKTLVKLPGADHNNWLTDEYLTRFDEFIAGLRLEPEPRQ